jgi:hypothetical protein
MTKADYIFFIIIGILFLLFPVQMFLFFGFFFFLGTFVAVICSMCSPTEGQMRYELLKDSYARMKKRNAKKK